MRKVSWLAKLISFFALLVGVLSTYFAVTQIPNALRHYTELPENYELLFIGPNYKRDRRALRTREVEAEIFLSITGVFEKKNRNPLNGKEFNFWFIYSHESGNRALDSDFAPIELLKFSEQNARKAWDENGRVIHTFMQRWGRIGTAPNSSILLESDWHSMPPYSRIEVELVFKTPEKYYWTIVYPVSGLTLSLALFLMFFIMRYYDKKMYVANFPFGRQSPHSFRSKR